MDFGSPGGDVFYSPNTSNARSPQPLADSFLNRSESRKIRSPQLTAAFNGSLNASSRTTTIYDIILQWFNEEITLRRLRSSIIFALTAAVVFFFSSILAKIAFLSPIVTIKEVLYSFVSLSSYIKMVLAGGIYFATAFGLHKLVVHDRQSSQISRMRSESWLSFVMSLFSSSIVTSFLLPNSLSSYDGLFILLLVCSSIVATYQSVFNTDFRLKFPLSPSQTRLMQTITSVFGMSDDSILVSSARTVSHILVGSIALGLFCGPVFFGFSSLLVLFSLNTYLLLGLVTLQNLLIWRMYPKIVKAVVMQPITFPLPPPYAVCNPTPEETRNLVNVLEVQDTLLKLFAFCDLQRIARSDPKRRGEIFSLSKPGGHPRNWTAVYASCTRVIDEIKSHIEVATARLTGATPDEEEDDAMKEMMLLPNKARKQVFSSPVVKRHKNYIKSIKQNAPVATNNNWISKMKNAAHTEALVISNYQAQLAVFAVDSLCILTIESYTEDKYGMVQKDLANIVRTLCGVLSSINRFLKVRANVAYNESSTATVYQLESALQTALTRIQQQYGKHFKSIGLSQTEMDILRIICPVDSEE